ncbi:hypothetical protein E9163_22855, partial [Klebsiella pneumoniae subsp. pneumoniae]
SAQIREILISESAWEEMTCLFAPSLDDAALSITRGLARREDHSRQLFIAWLPRRTPPGPRGPQTALG